MPKPEAQESGSNDAHELSRATDSMIRSAQSEAAREAAEPKPSK